MKLLADTHVHLYDCFKLDTFFRCAAQNFERIRVLGGFDQDTAYALFLTERQGQFYFARIAENPASMLPEGFSCERIDQWCLKLTTPRSQQFYLFAGRQLVTQERIEVLALTTDTALPECEPFEVVLRGIHQAGAVPVLPWSFGKWWFKRGDVIARMLKLAVPGSVLLADSSLRPRGAWTSKHFRKAEGRGIGLLAGSDPFPFPGQEKLVGTFVTAWDAGFNPQQASASVRALLSQTPFRGQIKGQRSSLGASILRLMRPYHH